MRPVRFAAAVAVFLSLAAISARADVRLTRRSDGSALIFNDVGSGWTVSGRAPSDAYLVSRRAAPSAFDALIGRHASREGIDALLVKCVVLVESNFNPRAVSRKGARGLMQLMPGTANRYGVRDLFDADQNVRGGVAYLADLLSLFDGDVTLALAAYNAGEGAVQRHGGIPPFAETREYVRRAMVAYRGSAPDRVLSGGFGSKPGSAVRASSRRGAVRVASVPVRLAEAGGQLTLSNDPGGLTRRTPILGRVPDVPATTGR